MYSLHYASLILVIEENVHLNEKNRKRLQKVFKYDASERGRFGSKQNVEETGELLSSEISVDEFFNQAWYREYLLWEEKQINE